MTQFGKRTHRARQRLERMTRAVPQIWSELEKSRKGALWPDWCYIPTQVVAHDGRADSEQGTLTAVSVTVMAAWRMTQGIYRFDPTIYDAVRDTPIDSGVPREILMRMPEWCVYVEAPGIADDLHGAWAMLDPIDPAGISVRLLYLLDTDPAPIPAFVALTGDSVRESLERAAADAGLAMSGVPGAARIVGQLTSLLLYVCSQQDDIAGKGRPGNPKPVRTRRDGWRLFPADGLHVWDVGVRMGAALRRAYQAEQTGTGDPHQGPRPHVRTAHWHTFLSGARKRPDGTDIPAADRRRDLRWMPPIPVNVNDIDALPAVIRRVRQ